MPRYIMKLTDDRDKRDYYLLWSTIVDAPVSGGYSLGEFKKLYRAEYGENGMMSLPDRLVRVEEYGTSCFFEQSSEDLIRCNRAGEKEAELTKEEIIDMYCRIKNQQSDTTNQ